LPWPEIQIREKQHFSMPLPAPDSTTYPEAMIADYRYGYTKAVLKQGVVRHAQDRNRLQTSDRSSGTEEPAFGS